MSLHDLVIHFILTVSLAVVGTLAPIFTLLASADITFWFQLASYSSSIIVGAVTVYKTLKKNK